MNGATRIIAADAAGIAEAAALILDGQIVAMPTETVYGLAGDATNGEAVANIYAAKGRPGFNPLIVHVSGPEMVSRYADIPEAAHKLMALHWPGPLTLVLPLRPDAGISSLVTAGLDTLAVRCPDHRVPQNLIAATGRPLAAPSANASGRISPTRAVHVLKSLGGRIPLILDGGAARAGLESTIIAVGRDNRLRLLREGALPADVIGPALDESACANDRRPQSPGQMSSHYAPRQPMRLNAREARPDEYLIGFAGIAGDANLSASGNLTEAAAHLFDMLHQAEESGRGHIAVAPIPNTGLGRAINDRLRRAAADRNPA